MSVNVSLETDCRAEIGETNSTCSQMEPTVTASVISMTVGIISNSLALVILVKSYHRIRLKSKASFLLLANGLVVTDLLGHLINGSLVLFVYNSHKKWESFDPNRILCSFFGACMVFFGLSPLFLGCAMAVERCIGVTRPLLHSTAVAPHHMKMVLFLTWLLAALVALLPVLFWRPYQVQRSRSWCFFRMEGPRDWLDVLLPLLFSMLGLLALLFSIVCNTLTSCALLQSILRRKHHCRGTSYHLEMICQLLAIMLVSCMCWGPLLIQVIILSSRATGESASFSLLLVVRMATWNQILDPWVYILLRKAVLKKPFSLLHSFWAPNSHDLQRHKCKVFWSSVEKRNSSVADCYCRNTIPLSDSTIQSIAGR